MLLDDKLLTRMYHPTRFDKALSQGLLQEGVHIQLVRQGQAPSR
jgi:hypothetical protein